MHYIPPLAWLAIIVIGIAAATFLMFLIDYEVRHSVAATSTTNMKLFHIDTVSGPESLYVWADSFDTAYRGAVHISTMLYAPLGDIRVRQVFKNHEASRFNPPASAGTFEVATRRTA